MSRQCIKNECNLCNGLGYRMHKCDCQHEPMGDDVLRAVRERDELMRMARTIELMESKLEAHRRFHDKAGCPGLPECYVCRIDHVKSET